MDLSKLIYKYFFIVSGTLIILAIVLTMFTPTVFSFDIDSNWIRYSTLFSSFRIDTSTLELTIHPILELGADFPL
ncbi:MAG: hypothetical protein ACTSRW_17570, partial [Candidatus Helarchaeota archaeon]